MIVSMFDNVTPDPVVHGGKGAGLIWMHQNGIKVPPALVIPTSVCREYMVSPKTTMKSVKAAIEAKSTFFKDIFGYQPLLSIRSGARASLPGMLDTILNVGLDTKSLNQWEQRLGTECTMDSYKRLITMYGNVVKGADRTALECKTLPETLAAYERIAKEAFPEAKDQLINSIEAVFKSWNNERAKVYRKLNNIPEDWGTAVVIQAMVFGNLNEDSGTGVLFTRDPDSGVNKVVGEFLMNAQGEDVVAGTATPVKLDKLKDWSPEIAHELLATVGTLEKLKSDVQDVEFTIQDKVLYILQTRTAKRSAQAAVKIAMDMVNEKLITVAEAISRVSERELDLANQATISPAFKKMPDYIGIPACSGVVTGIVCRSSEDVIKVANTGVRAILVSEETTPDDIAGMNAAVGILTMTGGSTSHAAVVARSMNRACIVGIGKEHHGKFKDGDNISLDGATGRVWFGEVPTVGGNNPIVGAFRAAKLGEVEMLVSGPPSFYTPRLSLQLGGLLHFSDAVIQSTIKGCLDKCKTLSLAYTEGESAVFMTSADITARLGQITGYLESISSVKVTTYGFTAGSVSHPIQDSMSLESLVLATSNVFVQSIAAKQTPAQKKVLKWLAADGVSVQLWNSKGSTGPVAYTVATA